MNFHLVPDQDPDDILAKLTAHLRTMDWETYRSSLFGVFDRLRVPARSPLGNALLRAARRVGVGSCLLPHSFEFGDKWCWLGQLLGVEGALIGIADPDPRAHFVNEHISVPYYMNGIKWVAAAMWEYAQENQ